MPPGPVKISHKKDGRQRRPHRFHVSCPPLPGRWIRHCVDTPIATKADSIVKVVWLSH